MILLLDLLPVDRRDPTVMLGCRKNQVTTPLLFSPIPPPPSPPPFSVSPLNIVIFRYLKVGSIARIKFFRKKLVKIQTPLFQKKFLPKIS